MRRAIRMPQPVWGKVVPWTVAVLVPVLVAGWIWWRESDTGARWRFEDAMDSFCGGLLAHRAGPLFEGLPVGTMLENDRRLRQDAWACGLQSRRLQVVVARLREGEEERVARVVPDFRGKRSPAPVGGGWQGSSDGDLTVIVVGCRNSEDRIAVSVNSYRSREEQDEHRLGGWADSDLFWARFATATAVEAAGRWDCEPRAGEALTALPPVPAAEPVGQADGACAGLPFARDQRLDTVHETPPGRGGLMEGCTVTSADFDGSYVFRARFGLAAAQRSGGDFTGRSGDAGADGSRLWGSARCPGDAVRSTFTGYLPPEARTAPDGRATGERFGPPAFRAFAERAVARHGCTDLKLPPTGR